MRPFTYSADQNEATLQARMWAAQSSAGACSVLIQQDRVLYGTCSIYEWNGTALKWSGFTAQRKAS